MVRRFFNIIISIVIIFLNIGTPLNGQISRSSSQEKRSTTDDNRGQKKEKQEYEDFENANTVLWQDPGDLEKRDLFYGIGGQDGAPDPSRTFVFIRRDNSGSKEKIEVEDDQNRKWTIKLGSEARAEVTATRIVWAVGFHVDQNYFVRRARIESSQSFDVEDVRFERDDDGYKTLGRWPWTSNPFVGTRELDGLRTLMALLNNYDLKTENKKIVRPDTTNRGEKENILVYYVNDLGATLGSTGTWLTTLPILGKLSTGTKGMAEDFANHRFIKGVKNGEVVFHYKRRRAAQSLKGVKVENARWMGNLLSRLSDQQLQDAFRAGGFDDRETAVFVKAIRTRIRQLKELS